MLNSSLPLLWVILFNPEFSPLESHMFPLEKKKKKAETPSPYENLKNT